MEDERLNFKPSNEMLNFLFYQIRLWSSHAGEREKCDGKKNARINAVVTERRLHLLHRINGFIAFWRTLHTSCSSVYAHSNDTHRRSTTDAVSVDASSINTMATEIQKQNGREQDRTIQWPI